jgi:hypothetical protein
VKCCNESLHVRSWICKDLPESCCCVDERRDFGERDRSLMQMVFDAGVNDEREPGSVCPIYDHREK